MSSFADELDSLAAILKESLIALGRNASRPQPKLGLNLPIEPLYAVAPLRYLHEGDLLKLRLQLNNVSLEGLSSLTLQEVSCPLSNIIFLFSYVTTITTTATTTDNNNG